MEIIGLEPSFPMIPGKRQVLPEWLANDIVKRALLHLMFCSPCYEVVYQINIPFGQFNECPIAQRQNFTIQFTLTLSTQKSVHVLYLYSKQLYFFLML
jgi:hypothetical protein